MIMPKRVKYRKSQRGRRAGKAYRGSTVAFGDFGLKAMEPAWITSRQIEACRVALTRKMNRDGKVWIRIFPDKPVPFFFRSDHSGTPPYFPLIPSF